MKNKYMLVQFGLDKKGKYKFSYDGFRERKSDFDGVAEVTRKSNPELTTLIVKVVKVVE